MRMQEISPGPYCLLQLEKKIMKNMPAIGTPDIPSETWADLLNPLPP
jgi:hypothetical protein